MRLIDADELREYWLYNGLNEKIYDTNDWLESIDDWPTIDPESLRPTAHWIRDSAGSTNVVCSACNAISFAAYNFCPECGKRMVNADERKEKENATD